MSLKKMDLRGSFIYTALPAILLYYATRWFIPYLHETTGLPLVVCWYISGGGLVFIPMTVLSLIFYRREGNEWSKENFIKRFWLEKPSGKTISIGLLGVIITGIATYAVMELCKALMPEFSASPSFLRMHALSPGEYWILLAWLPLFFFNIIGEAFYWRGFMFPKQYEIFGSKTWLVHGACWLAFHFSFGINLLITLLPIIFITPYLVQRTKSAWTDIIIHGLINGSGFILVAFGIVS
jgi:membrane protease YdiL (CAAX protease family)